MKIVVLEINYESTPTYKPVTCKADYDKVQRHIYRITDSEVLIPEWKTLDIQHKGNIVVFTEPWWCEVTVLINGKKYILRYDCEIGFISDKGSVPKKARSFIDNDAPEWLIPFFLHDIGFDTHDLGSRNLTDQILKYTGMYGAIRETDTAKPRASYAAAQAVYIALYLFGRGAWKNDRLGNPNIKEYASIEKIPCV
jgi:hypothetical protein